jgi:hypothetical protein
VAERIDLDLTSGLRGSSEAEGIQMAESNPYNRKTHPAEWQEWINQQVAAHAQEQKDSGNKFQQDEVSPARSPEEIQKYLRGES